MKLLLYSIIIGLVVFKTGKPCFEQAPVIYKDSLATGFFQKETGCIAGDGGFSVPLSNGNVLWLMGDSHINDYDAATKTVPCLFQVRNTALLQPVNDWDNKHTITLTGNRKGLKSFLKNNSNDTFFCWPGAGIQLKDSVYIYCASLKNQGTGAFGFAEAGNDFMASFHVNNAGDKHYQSLPDFKGISFGVAFIKDETSKWVYVYGQKYTAPKIQCDLYVARFAANQPLKNWAYWNGHAWESNVDEAVSIATQNGVSGTFQVSKVNSKYLLLSSALSINCDSGTEIFSATADKVVGPFTQKKLLYKIDDQLQGHTPFFYAAIAHPEYINDKGELLITYAINGYGTCLPDCNNNRMNPDLYRLRGIRVPIKLLTDTSE